MECPKTARGWASQSTGTRDGGSAAGSGGRTTRSCPETHGGTALVHRLCLQVPMVCLHQRSSVLLVKKTGFS